MQKTVLFSSFCSNFLSLLPNTVLEELLVSLWMAANLYEYDWQSLLYVVCKLISDGWTSEDLDISILSLHLVSSVCP